MSTFLEFAISLLSLLDIIFILVLNIVAIFCEDVLAFDLNVVNLRFEHLLATHSILSLTFILINLQSGFICSILQLFLDLYFALLLVA